MKIEIRPHFWPATPNLREIKIVVDGKVITSSFMNKAEIHHLALSMKNIYQILIEKMESIEE